MMPRRIGRNAAHARLMSVINRDHREACACGLLALGEVVRRVPQRTAIRDDGRQRLRAARDRRRIFRFGAGAVKVERCSGRYIGGLHAQTLMRMVRHHVDRAEGRVAKHRVGPLAGSAERPHRALPWRPLDRLNGQISLMKRIVEVDRPAGRARFVRRRRWPESVDTIVRELRRHAIGVGPASHRPQPRDALAHGCAEKMMIASAEQSTLALVHP